MTTMATQDPNDRAERWASGRLDPQGEAAFEAELLAVPRLQALVAACLDPAGLPPAPPSALAKQQLLDLAHAPQLPIDLEAVAWEEPLPGLKLHVVHEDKQRGVRGCLVWVKPGFRNVVHRHLGDEIILVLDGELRDERGTYKSGEICHSRAGSVHYEEIAPEGDCLAYVVYYGELEFLGGE